MGRGTIDDDFSTGFSSFSTAAAFSSAKSFDSVVAAVVGDPFRPRLRRLNCGLGFNRRETVELSASDAFSVVEVVGWVRKLKRLRAFDPNFEDD